MLGLSCGTQDLRFLLWHVESSSLTSSLTSSLMETRLPALRVRSLGHQGSPYQASFKGEEMDTKKLRDLFKVMRVTTGRHLHECCFSGSKSGVCVCVCVCESVYKNESSLHSIASSLGNSPTVILPGTFLCLVV